MSIAVDQSRLRRIVDRLLGDATLERAEANAILEIAQLAAGIASGAGLDDDPAEHAALQAVAQHLGALVGFKQGEILAIPSLPDPDARLGWLGALAEQLTTRGAREVAFAFAFLVSVADLELTTAETTALEEFQRALAVDDRRATDLVVLLAETLAADEPIGEVEPAWGLGLS